MTLGPLDTFVSLSYAAKQLKLPGKAILADFERLGLEVFRRGRRVRLKVTDVEVLIRDMAKPSPQDHKAWMDEIIAEVNADIDREARLR